MKITNILYIEDSFDHYSRILSGFKSKYEVVFFPVNKEDDNKGFKSFLKENITPVFRLSEDENDTSIHKAEEDFKQYIIDNNIHLIIIDADLGIDNTKSEGGSLSDLLSDMEIPVVILTIGQFSNYSYIVKKTPLNNIDFIVEQIILKINEQIAPDECNFNSEKKGADITKKTTKNNILVNNEDYYNQRGKITALASLFGKESLNTDIAYINLLRKEDNKDPFEFKNGYNLQIIFISWIQYIMELFCILFLFAIGCTSLYKVITTIYSYLCNDIDSAIFIGDIISGIEYLFLAPLPYLITVGYLRTYTIRHPLHFDRKIIAFERLQEKKFFIGSLIGIVATNLVKVLLNLPTNYFVWRAIFINLIFPIIAHIAVISILIYFYNKLSEKHH